MNERIRELAKEAIANVRFWDAEKEVYDVGHDELAKFAELIRADEREACAKLCDDYPHGMGLTERQLAQAIRARGEQ